MSDPSATDRPIVEMRDIEKHFGAVHALRNASLKLMPGEILGLVGDNSAGKSTLMKVLTGAYQRDGGEVLVDGKITDLAGSAILQNPCHEHQRSPHSIAC